MVLIDKYRKDPAKSFLILLLSALFLYGLIATSLYRVPYSDELLYLQETRAMYDIVQSGDWIGNYPVGVHGFLFKLPPVLLFFITGPSIFIATMWNVLLALASLYLVYKLVKDRLGFDNANTIYALLILAGSAQFVIYFSTYYRDIAAVFSLVLSIYIALGKKQRWLLGFALMLLLDAKEHIFFTSIPAFILYEFFNTDERFVGRIGNTAIILSISVLYIILSNLTSLLPLNIYIPFLFRFTEASELKIGMARLTNNLKIVSDAEIVREIVGIQKDGFIYILINFVLKFIGKIMYPRTFGFLSLPLIFILPALYKMFVEILKVKSKLFLISLIAFFNFFAYMLTYSHGRYLFPVFAVYIILYLTWAYELKSKKKINKWVIGITAVLNIAALYFEYGQMLIKLFLSLIMTVSFVLPHLMKHRFRLLFAMHIILSSGILASVGFAYLLSPSQHGQLIVAHDVGSNYSVPDVIAYLENQMDISDKKILVSDSRYGRILEFYTGSFTMHYGFGLYTLKSFHPRSSSINDYVYDNVVVSQNPNEPDVDIIINILPTNSRNWLAKYDKKIPNGFVLDDVIETKNIITEVYSKR